MPTTPSAPHLVLMAHARWANAELYDACTALNPELLVRPFDMGTGSIRNNLVHNLGAVRGWTDVLDEAESRPRLETETMLLPDIRAIHDEIWDDFERAALRRPVETVITRQREDQSYTFTVGGIIAHVTTHSVHHRAQCLNMLRQLGTTDLPMSSVMEWMLHAPEQ